MAPFDLPLERRSVSEGKVLEANQIMVQRLRSIAGGHVEPTIADLNFYTHELREAVRYRRLGWRIGQPADLEAAHNLWNDAHAATLEDYRLTSNLADLYHPDALKVME